MTKPSQIAIMMATYNGEKYLSEQIDSILNQTFQDWHLYVHDDGSYDNTVAVLQEYIRSHPDKITLLDYPPVGGACNNFLSILQKVEAFYYMFCDQDDVWLPEKIERTYQLMHQTEHVHTPDTPILIHTDLTVVNENKEVISPSFWEYSRIYPQWFKNYEDYAALNPVTGCTMLFNAKAKEVVKPSYNAATMHDSWITFSVVAANGIVGYLSDTTILYRQHVHNTLGARGANTITLSYKIKNILSIIRHKRARFKEFNAIRSIGVCKYMNAKKRYLRFLKNMN